MSPDTPSGQVGEGEMWRTIQAMAGDMRSLLDKVTTLQMDLVALAEQVKGMTDTQSARTMARDRRCEAHDLRSEKLTDRVSALERLVASDQGQHQEAQRPPVWPSVVSAVVAAVALMVAFMKGGGVP